VGQSVGYRRVRRWRVRCSARLKLLAQWLQVWVSLCICSRSCASCWLKRWFGGVVGVRGGSLWVLLPNHVFSLSEVTNCAIAPTPTPRDRLGSTPKIRMGSVADSSSHRGSWTGVHQSPKSVISAEHSRLSARRRDFAVLTEMASFAKLLPGVAVITGAGGTGEASNCILCSQGLVY
jgi:hypothetical protein